MDEILKCFSETSGTHVTEEQLLSAYDKLCSILKNLKREDAAKRQLQNPSVVSQLGKRFLQDTSVFPGSGKNTKKPPVLMKALKALGFFSHIGTLSALLAEDVSTALCDRLCDILRQTTSVSVQHTTVWCVYVEALRKRQQCWKYFQAIGAMLCSSTSTSSQGVSEKSNVSVVGGSSSAQSTNTQQSSVIDALECDALKDMAVLVPIVREDIINCNAESIREWAPPVYTRLLSESANIRHEAAQVINALLVHVVPLPEALSECFVRDIGQLDFIARFRSLFFADTSNEHLVCAGAETWGIMAGLFGRFIFEQEAKEFRDLSSFFFTHGSVEVRSAAFTSWSYVVQTGTRDAIGATESGQNLVKEVMRPFYNLLSVGEQSDSVLTSAFKCWMTVAMKLDAPLLMSSFNVAVSDFARGLAAQETSPDFIISQLCTFFDSFIGYSDARSLSVQSCFTMSWLSQHSAALCYPFHVILRRSSKSPQCQALLPTVRSFLTSFIKRISEACKYASSRTTTTAEQDNSDCLECMRVATSLATVLVQKIVAAAKLCGSFSEPNEQMFRTIFNDLPVEVSGLPSKITFKVNVDSPSAQSQYTFLDHMLCLLATSIFSEGFPRFSISDGTDDELLALLVLSFKRSLVQDLVQSHSGNAVAIVSRALSTAVVGTYSRKDHCIVWCQMASVAGEVFANMTPDDKSDDDDLCSAVVDFMVTPFNLFATNPELSSIFITHWEHLAVALNKLYHGSILEQVIDQTTQSLDRLNCEVTDGAFLHAIPALIDIINWGQTESLPSVTTLGSVASRQKTGSSVSTGSFHASTEAKLKTCFLRALTQIMARVNVNGLNPINLNEVSGCVCTLLKRIPPESVPDIISVLSHELNRWISATSPKAEPSSYSSIINSVQLVFDEFGHCIRRVSDDALVSNLMLFIPIFKSALESQSRHIRETMINVWNDTYGPLPELDCPQLFSELIISVAEVDQLEIKMQFLEDVVPEEDSRFHAALTDKDSSRHSDAMERTNRKSSVVERGSTKPSPHLTPSRRIPMCDPSFNPGNGIILKGSESLSLDGETQPPMGSLGHEQPPNKKARHSGDREPETIPDDGEAPTLVQVFDQEPQPQPPQQQRMISQRTKSRVADRLSRAEELTKALDELTDILEVSATQWDPENLVHISRCCERMNSSIVLALSNRLSGIHH